MGPDRDRALDGFLPPEHPLSPRSALEAVSPLIRPLVRYEPRAWWEEDTARLPPELGAYRRWVRDFAERVVRPRALEADAAPHAAPGACEGAARDVLEEAGRAGLLSDFLPWPLGAQRAAIMRHPLFLPQALKVEELAVADGGLMLLISAHGLGVAPVLLSGEVSAIRRWVLPAYRASLRGAPHLFAFAITEPDAGSDVEDSLGAALLRPGTVARRVDGGWSLRGRKVYISGGDVAKSVVVFAALEGEGMESWTVFLVSRDTPGFRAARTELKMGMRASSAAELLFDDVHVPDAAVIGGLRKGWALNKATLNMSRIPVGAMGVGFARAATELATDFACRFRLAGKPLVAYQEVQLELAQMAAETASARALVWHAASRFQARQGEASATKFHATDVARRVCERAMDLLGNHAVLHDERVEKALRDARLAQIFEGTNEINRLGVIEDAQEDLLERIGR